MRKIEPLPTYCKSCQSPIKHGWLLCEICDVISLKVTENAKRDNSGKAKLSYIPRRAQEAEARVWEFGGKKYGRRNWEKGLPWLSVIDSLLRHAMALQSGEINDPETGEHHAAHIRCNAAMLIEFEHTHPELDDRKK